MGEGMTKPDAWMPFYPGDYLADTSRLTLEQHGAYLLLILDYWRNGPPPDDDATLARILGITAGAWRRIAPSIRAMFRPVDGLLRHKRIDAEKEGATNRKAKAKAKAEQAAAVRWGNPPSNAPSMPQAMHEQCPSPSPSPITSKAEPKPAQAAPAGVRFEVWEAWRRQRGRKLTADAVRLQAKFLSEQPDDPNAVIEQSIRNGWAGLFPLKRDGPQAVQTKRAATAAAMLRSTPKGNDEATDITAESVRVA
jgi:uncharacterized protein YdaU (DUF1376 family)